MSVCVCVCTYKEDLALNNPLELIYHITQSTNQPNLFIFVVTSTLNFSATLNPLQQTPTTHFHLIFLKNF